MDCKSEHSPLFEAFNAFSEMIYSIVCACCEIKNFYNGHRK